MKSLSEMNNLSISLIELISLFCLWKLELEQAGCICSCRMAESGDDAEHDIIIQIYIML